MLLLADRLFVGAQLWRVMARTGAELVAGQGGSKTAPKPPVDQVCSDGSWLSRLYAASDRRKRHPITVRVIEYTLADPGRRTSTDRCRLVTTILGPAAAPAHELAALYAQRWEIETALAELKTTQRGPKQVLRSRSPELVAQEVWAHLLVHYALRAVMHTAALEEDLDPDRLLPPRRLRLPQSGEAQDEQLPAQACQASQLAAADHAARQGCQRPARSPTWRKLPKPLTGRHCG